MIRKLACLAVAITSVVVVPRAVAGEAAGRLGWAEVTVEGGRDAKGAFTLALDFQPNMTKTATAVLVYAEPSHTLILAHWNGSAQPKLLGGELPLVATEGVFGRSAPRVIVRLDAKGDSRIIVQVLYREERFTAADAKVNVESFSFVTRFDPDNLGWNHCCSCAGCAKVCEDCSTSRFTCDCIGCTITCG